jgi:hypothetical protein
MMKKRTKKLQHKTRARIAETNQEVSRSMPQLDVAQLVATPTYEKKERGGSKRRKRTQQARKSPAEVPGLLTVFTRKSPHPRFLFVAVHQVGTRALGWWYNNNVETRMEEGDYNGWFLSFSQT